MNQTTQTGASKLPDLQDFHLSDIGIALRAGLRDYLRAPLFGLFFSAVYVLGGFVLYMVLSAAGEEWWLIPFFVGFPLLAPFAAVGLYEVSRRLENGVPLNWPQVLGVVFAQRQRQLPSIAMVILLLFMFWVFVGHTIFALFMGMQALTNVTTSPGVLLEGNGPVMLLVGSAVGAAFAMALFSFTVVGLPLLLEYEVDFITAIITSIRVVIENLPAMIAWGLVIGILLLIGMLPFFLGLFITLPILGHASWHVYRRVVPER